MRGLEYILARQVNWALNRGISLTGSRGDRGRPTYTTRLEENLFRTLLEPTRREFGSGDGNEVAGRDGAPGKMQAVHSSSALAVNVFEYWRRIGAVPQVAAACGLCRTGSQVSRALRFEQKYAIDDAFDRSPNMDVVFENRGKGAYRLFGVECKFSEAYGGRGHPGLSPKYLGLDEIWKGLSHLKTLAEQISPYDTLYRHLHPAQLVKHILAGR